MPLYWHFNGGFNLTNMMKKYHMNQVIDSPFFLQYKKKINVALEFDFESMDEPQ